ncbi:hypothetical protein PFY12_01645 [Chryseobacterium camelliae]|uniref:Uncharacterized protein n=1 Tax=Chryseobacterium camelliae TaxID=1265445 RepID=A0ABY7QQ30_9FLAO|nr:hypothetical protein [Chryseobacterium camelliae]WBV60836.1 hypothetical protein PFY12_01645 [Chryseobacterium camelliae]
MKRIMKQLGKLSLIITMCISFLGFNIKPPTKNLQKRILMIGIAYQQKKCGSSSFSDAVGYKPVPSCYGGTYSTIENEIKADLSKWYNVNKSDVTIKASDKAFGAVISYYKEISGWNCSVKRFAVGFGDTQQEAYDAAERNKNNDAKTPSYKVEKTFYCNN